MRAQDCVWRQPSDLHDGQSIQLTRKLVGYWVNSVGQERLRRGRGHTRNTPSRDASPTPGALPPSPVSTETRNLSPTVPGPSEPGCGQSLADKPNRAGRLAGSRREES